MFTASGTPSIRTYLKVAPEMKKQGLIQKGVQKVKPWDSPIVRAAPDRHCRKLPAGSDNGCSDFPVTLWQID